MPRTPRIPQYRHHKSSGQGFVELNGHYVYLGKWGLPETEQNYLRTVHEWLANGRRLSVETQEISIVELEAAYWADCKVVYRGSAAHLDVIKHALRPLRLIYGETSAAEFGPLALRAMQEHWASKGLSRTTVNRYIGMLKRMFRWAVSRELVPASVWHGLDAVEGLRAGRSPARDAKVIVPVSDSDIAAIREFVPPAVWTLIQLQLLTGARSGELVNLRPCDVDRTTGDVWTATLKKHKGAWRGRDRVLFFGPQTQQLLRPFLLRAAEAYLFDPREGVAWHAAQCETHRRSDQESAAPKTKRRVRDHYDVGSYRRAIARACERAGIAPWHPHQLRHTAATAFRKQFGLEAAQVMLGHAGAKITELYAERDAEKAREIAAKMG
jgi:integrase